MDPGDALGFSHRLQERITALEDLARREAGQATSYRAAYEATLVRMASLQAALDQTVKERDDARTRVNQLELKFGYHVTGGAGGQA